MTSLDDFVIKNGEEMTSEPQMVPKESILSKLSNTYAYDSNIPIPGETINDEKIMSNINDINENTALSSLIANAAMIKAKKEKNTVTKEQLNKLKEDFCKQLLQQQEDEYYNKHGFIMNGQLKRRTRKIIEKNFDKGKYNKYLQPAKSLND